MQAHPVAAAGTLRTPPPAPLPQGAVLTLLLSLDRRVDLH